MKSKCTCSQHPEYHKAMSVDSHKVPVMLPHVRCVTAAAAAGACPVSQASQRPGQRHATPLYSQRASASSPLRWPHQVINPQLLQLQHHGAQVGAKNLRVCLLLQVLAEGLLRVQPEALARPCTPRTPRPLVCRRLQKCRWLCVKHVWSTEAGVLHNGTRRQPGGVAAMQEQGLDTYRHYVPSHATPTTHGPLSPVKWVTPAVTPRGCAGCTPSAWQTQGQSRTQCRQWSGTSLLCWWI